MSDSYDVPKYSDYLLDFSSKLPNNIDSVILWDDEYVDEYLDNEPYYQQQVISHTNTDLAFSPNIVANAGFTYLPISGLSIDWLTTYVGRQY